MGPCPLWLRAFPRDIFGTMKTEQGARHTERFATASRIVPHTHRTPSVRPLFTSPHVPTGIDARERLSDGVRNRMGILWLTANALNNRVRSNKTTQR